MSVSVALIVEYCVRAWRATTVSWVEPKPPWLLRCPTSHLAAREAFTRSPLSMSASVA